LPEGTRLAAPLAPNINHRDTVFGGSAAALATLAAWTLLHARLTAAGLPSRLVIQRNTMDYDAPIPDDFTAEAALKVPAQWNRFATMLERRGLRPHHRRGEPAVLRCHRGAIRGWLRRRDAPQPSPLTSARRRDRPPPADDTPHPPPKTSLRAARRHVARRATLEETATAA
jgi:hypothetical protein